MLKELCTLALLLSLAVQSQAATPSINGEWTICGQDLSGKQALTPVGTVHIDEAARTIAVPERLFDIPQFHFRERKVKANAKEIRTYALAAEDAWRRAVNRNGLAASSPLRILNIR